MFCMPEEEIPDLFICLCSLRYFRSSGNMSDAFAREHQARASLARAIDCALRAAARESEIECPRARLYVVIHSGRSSDIGRLYTYASTGAGDPALAHSYIGPQGKGETVALYDG